MRVNEGPVGALGVDALPVAAEVRHRLALVNILAVPVQAYTHGTYIRW